jgi:ectoine hydroxylase-related dioxygenase (phytanoyl-CoA dioxygenase family)
MVLHRCRPSAAARLFAPMKDMDMQKLAVANECVASVDLAQRVEEFGFAVVPTCLDEEMVERLCSHLSETTHALRNLLALPIVRDLAVSVAVRTLAEAVLGKNCFAVKGTFFNKTQESNWKVAWHQDLTIMVRERREAAGFGPWTMKADIVHVQPPAEVLSRILAVRLHLDESGPDNGPLRVLPGSHRQGRISSEKVAEWQKRSSVVCTIPRGGALLMRPLLLHASSTCVAPKPRRVIHLEFAADELPEGLEWFDRVQSAAGV